MSSRGSNKADLDDVQLLLDEGGGEEKDFGRILVLKINYHLQHSVPGVSAGLVFRQPCGELCGDGGVTDANPSSSSSSTSSTSCSVYSMGGGTGMLRDLDGVRCWLPCIDSPDQRAVFDITLHCPSEFQVITCGKKISSSVTSCAPSERKERVRRMHKKGMGPDPGKDNPPSTVSAAAMNASPLEHCFAAFPPVNTSPIPLNAPPQNREIMTSRFFTVTRLPAMSVGFFIGQVIRGALLTSLIACLFTDSVSGDSSYYHNRKRRMIQSLYLIF